jgi:hypothetical protein
VIAEVIDSGDLQLINEQGMQPSKPKGNDDKLTPEQVKQFEREHKLLFIYLAITNNTYCNLFDREYKAWHAKKLAGSFTDTPEGKIVANLGRTIRLKAKGWYEAQTFLEKNAHIPKVSVTINDFLVNSKRGAISIQAGKYIDKSGKINGIGIIPLIIWGAILIIGAISAAYIVHRLTTTTQDRQDLLKATEQTCKDLNLTPDQCANVVTTVQKEETNNSKGVTDSVTAVSTGLSDIFLYGGLALIGVLLITSKSK